MKINGSSNPLDISQSSASSQGGVRKTGSGAAASGSEAVSLSGLSAQMHELEARLSAEPSFDSARVQQMKDAIRSGDYKVNAEAVADGLIDSVRQLLQQPRG
jgi:negative regulator of flagellin synthesis FlgM